MIIKIEIEGVSFKDTEEEGQQKFELEVDSFRSFRGVAKCIIQSGYIIRAYKIFDGSD